MVKIWAIGTYGSKADKDISWQDQDFPHLSDPDVLIVNLMSLTKENLTNVRMDLLNRLATSITDKFLNGGTVIFITQPFFKTTQYSAVNNYYFSPFNITTHNTGIGKEIVYNNEKMNELSLKGYLKNVEKFSFYLDNFTYVENLTKKLSESKIEEKLKMFAKITDKDNHILGAVITSARGGKIIYLPPVTRSQSTSIDILIEELRKDSTKDDNTEQIPDWVKNVNVEGLNETLEEIKKQITAKNKIDKTITEFKNKEDNLERLKKLLYSNGKNLEKSVYEAFRLIGFEEIRQDRERDKEDAIIDFKEIADISNAVIEIEGSEKRTSLEKLDQCNRWVNDYFLAGKEVKGVFVSNQFRLDEYPASQEKRTNYEHNQLKYVQTRHICVIPTCVLFEAVNKTLAGKGKTRKEIEELIGNTDGVLLGL